MRLKGLLEEEPRFIDLRWVRDAEDLSLRNPEFGEAIADLAAPLHGVPKDELAGEEVRQHRRTLRVARTAAVTLLLLTTLAIVGAVVALRERSSALQAAHVAESRALAGQAVTTLDSEPSRGMLLALQAYRLSPTFEAHGAVITALEHYSDQVLHPGLGTITSVALDTTGKTLAFGGGHGSVLTRDLATGRETRVGQLSSVLSIAFQPHGSLLVWGGGVAPARPRIGIRDLATGSVGEVPVRGSGLVAGVSFSGDGRVFAAGTRDGTVSAERFGNASRAVVMHTGLADLWGIALSPSGNELAAVGTYQAGGQVHGFTELWDVQANKLLRAWPARSSLLVKAVAFSPKGDVLVTGDENGTVQLWSPTTGSAIGSPMVTSGAFVNNLAFLNDSLLAGAYSDGSVRLWSTAAHAQVGPTLTGESGTVNSVAFGGVARLVSGGADGTIRLWDQRRLLPAQFSVLGERVPLPTNYLPPGLPLSLRGDLGVVAISADRTHHRVAVSQVAGPVGIWDSVTGHHLEDLPPDKTSDAQALTFSPDGRMLVTFGGTPLTMQLWSVANRAQIGVPVGGPGQVNAAAFSPDGKLLAVGSSDGVRMWKMRPFSQELACGGCMSMYGTKFSTEANSIAFSPDSRMLAFTYGAGHIRIWSTRTRQHVGSTIDASPTAIRAVSFSPDGRILASAGADGAARLWDVRTHRALGALVTSQASALDSVTFSSDGQTLLATGRDGNLRLWETASGRQLGQPLPLNADAADVPITAASALAGDVSSVTSDHVAVGLDSAIAAGTEIFGPLDRLPGNPLLLFPPALVRHSLNDFEAVLCPRIKTLTPPGDRLPAGICKG